MWPVCAGSINVVNRVAGLPAKQLVLSLSLSLGLSQSLRAVDWIRQIGIGLLRLTCFWLSIIQLAAPNS